MKTHITYTDLKAFGPCYDPKEIGMPGDYSAPILECIKEYRDKVKNKQDIIWILCREDYMTNKDIRLFAVWCARGALKLVKDPDPRSVAACDVAERYANREVTREELDVAGAAAWSAAKAAARAVADVAGVAAMAAAKAAARDAARAAAIPGADVDMDAQIDKLITYFQ